MKKFTPFMLCLSVAICCFQITHAQFLQKLKNKLTGTPASNTTTNPAPAATPAGQPQPVDFAKYNIATTVTYSASNVSEKNAYLQQQYSCVEIKDNNIVGKVIVYGTNQPNEAGEFDASQGAYVFENGALTSHTTVGDINNQKATLSATYSMYDWPYTSQPDAGITQMIQGNMGMQAFINFNGKKLGPYMMVSQISINSDKTKLYAIAAEMGSGNVTYYLIGSDGKKIKLPSLASGLMINQSFSNAGVYGFTAQLQQAEDANQNATQAATNTMNNSDIYFADGTVTKNGSNISGGGTPWLDVSGKNYLSADANFGAFINGKKIADKGVTPGQLWCNATADKWACFAQSGYNNSQVNHLIFSDGADIPYVFHPQQIVLNGTIYITWFQYDHVYSGNFVMCKKAL